MKFFLLSLSFVSVSSFSMDCAEKKSGEKIKQKKRLELVKEFLALPNGQLRTQYDGKQLCYVTNLGP
jgi:hypothetical protein